MPRPTSTDRRLRGPFVLLAVTLIVVAGVAASGIAGASSVTPEPLRRLVDPTTSSGGGDGDLGGRSIAATDDDQAAISQLDPDVRRALQLAAAAAKRDGVDLRVNSGWRSAAYQEELLQRAVRRYGSMREARRWVDTPQRSAHVRGEAVDVGPVGAALWLEQHGNAYGLCRRYANERWHFELLVRPGATCPPLRANAGAG